MLVSVFKEPFYATSYELLVMRGEETAVCICKRKTTTAKKNLPQKTATPFSSEKLPLFLCFQKLYVNFPLC